MISPPLKVQVTPRAGFAHTSQAESFAEWSVRSAVVVAPRRQSSVHISVPVSVGATFVAWGAAVLTAAQTTIRASQLASRRAMLDPLTDAAGAAFTVGDNLPLHIFR